MICLECGAIVPIYISRTRNVEIGGLKDIIYFTDKPNEDKTKDEIKAEKNYLKYYDKLYKDSIKDLEDKIAVLNALDAGLE